MASGANMLVHQKPAVEARLKSLINNDLKEICKAYSLPVSGTKAVLQKRCIDLLDRFVRSGQTDSFNDIRHRANNNGAGRNSYTSASTQPYSAAASYRPSTMGQNGAKLPLSSRLPTGVKYFKSSPFYEVVDTVLPLQDLLEMPQNRNTVRTILRLPDAITQQLKNDKSMRLLIYCGLTAHMAPHSPVDVQFPNQLDIKINDDDVRHNFKGLKNKVGTTKPADITDKCRLIAGYSNQIAVTYALTVKRYAYTIHLARHIGADSLVERIKTAKVIPKQRVIEEMNKANADPDIAATAIRMSLKDPISTVRITLPVRSTICSHNQCFDGAMFLQLQEQAPQWQCPVCSKNVTFSSLCVDKYFEDILENTPKSIDKVDIEPNGEWKVIKEEEETETNGAPRARASYDNDDDDDDLIEIIDPPGRSVNGTGSQPPPTNQYTPAATPNFFSNYTPPVFSRESTAQQSVSAAPQQSNKRPASTVIDLTFSDDEDEPPRPAKRVAPARPQANSTPALSSTPAPAPTHMPSPLPSYNTAAPTSQSQKGLRMPSFGQPGGYTPYNVARSPSTSSSGVPGLGRAFEIVPRATSATSSAGFGFQRPAESDARSPSVTSNGGFGAQWANDSIARPPSASSNSGFNVQRAGENTAHSPSSLGNALTNGIFSLQRASESIARPPSASSNGGLNTQRAADNIGHSPGALSNRDFSVQRTVESSQSPVLQANAASFGQLGFAQPARRPSTSGTSNGMPPFMFRPPSSQNGQVAQKMNSPPNHGLVLPPMHAQQQQQQQQGQSPSSPPAPMQNGWRSDATTQFSSSPS